MQQKQMPSMLWGNIQRVFDAACESGVCMGSIDSNFAWDEQYGLLQPPPGDDGQKGGDSSSNSKSSYMSFVVLCDHMKLLDEFFPMDESEESSLQSKYALYLVAKKFAVRRYSGGTFRSEGDLSPPGRVPLIAAYWTMVEDRKRAEKGQRGGGGKKRKMPQLPMSSSSSSSGLSSHTQELILDCLLEDGFNRVHLTLVSSDDDDRRDGSRRMEMFTLSKEEILFMREQVLTLPMMHFFASACA